MTAEKREKVLDKVRKMLALAGNNPSEEEAQSAMLLAQKLMVKHNLTMDDVEVPNEEKEVTEETVTGFTRTPWWYKSLGSIIAGNFKCECFYRNRNGQSSVRFLGLAEDVQIAKEIYKYAFDSINYHARKYVRRVRDNGGNTKGVRNDFVVGYLEGLKAKFEEQKEANKEDWGLVLVLDPAVQDVLDNMKFTKSKPSRATRQGNAEAYSSGYKHGNSFAPRAGNIEG